MDKAIILETANQDPEKLLRADTRDGIKINIDSAMCRVVKNNLKGGVIVFFPGGSQCLSWDKETRRWR